MNIEYDKSKIEFINNVELKSKCRNSTYIYTLEEEIGSMLNRSFNPIDLH
jgi:tRNA U55 pseudouridine synthase TruB